MSMRGIRRLAALAALLVLTGTAQAANGKRVLGHIPADCRGVAVINVERAVSSRYWSEIRGALARADDFKTGLARLEAAGFQLERDLKTVVAAFPDGIDGASSRSLIFLEGTFKERSMRALLGALDSKSKRRYGGTDLFAIDPEHSLAITSSLLIYGKNADVESSLDAASGRKQSMRKSGLAKALVRGINRNADLWMVADAAGGSVGPMAGSGPRAIAFSLDLTGGGLAIRATLDSGSSASAQQLVQTVNMGSAALANDASMQGMGLGPVIQKLKVVGDGPRVLFAVDLSESDVAGMAPLFEMVKSQIP